MEYGKQIIDLSREVGALSAKVEGLSRSNKEINKKLDESLSQGSEFIRCQIEVNNKLWGDEKFHDKGEIPRLLLAQEQHNIDIKILQEKGKQQKYYLYGLIPAISIAIGKYGEHVIGYIMKVLNA